MEVLGTRSPLNWIPVFTWYAGDLILFYIIDIQRGSEIVWTDPERYRFARETSFGRRHLNFWSRSPILVWIVSSLSLSLSLSFFIYLSIYLSSIIYHLFIYLSKKDPILFNFLILGQYHVISLVQVCFFRQFFTSVTKVDYLTLRHGFIMVSGWR